MNNQTACIDLYHALRQNDAAVVANLLRDNKKKLFWYHPIRGHNLLDWVGESSWRCMEEVLKAQPNFAWELSGKQACVWMAAALGRDPAQQTWAAHLAQTLWTKEVNRTQMVPLILGARQPALMDHMWKVMKREPCPSMIVRDRRLLWQSLRGQVTPAADKRWEQWAEHPHLCLPTRLELAIFSDGAHLWRQMVKEVVATGSRLGVGLLQQTPVADAEKICRSVVQAGSVKGVEMVRTWLGESQQEFLARHMDTGGLGVLHQAARQGRGTLLVLFDKWGADWHQPSLDGLTPLDILASAHPDIFRRWEARLLGRVVPAGQSRPRVRL